MNSSPRELGSPSSWPDLWFALDPSPRLVVAPGPQLVAANLRARQLLDGDGCGGWRIVGDNLELADVDRRRLDALIEKAAARGPQSDVIGAVLVRAYGLSRQNDVAALLLRDLSLAAEVSNAGLATAFGLTRTEQKVLNSIIQGCSVEEIAGALNNSVLTIRTHVKRLNAKLGVGSREQLFARVAPFLILD